MATQPDRGLNFDDLTQVLQEFLEVAIHYILYIRQIYPQDLFDQYKKFDVPVWKSRHPLLAAYVAKVVQACMPEIKSGDAQRFIIAIKDAATQAQLEHFVFGLTWIKPASWFADSEARHKFDSGLCMNDVELKLRAFFLKLSTLDAQLGPLPQDLTFSVFLEMSDEADPPTKPDPVSGDPSPWLPASMQEADAVADNSTSRESQSTPLSDPNARLHALKRTKLGMIDLELEVEESQAKWDFLQGEQAREQLQQERNRKGKGRA